MALPKSCPHPKGNTSIMTKVDISFAIYFQTGMAMDQLRLVHQGHYVTEGTIESTGIKSGENIHVF